jgi:hypothetical protein
MRLFLAARSVNRFVKAVSIISLVLVFGMVFRPMPGQAAQTIIETVICNSEQGATLSIASPESDSITDKNTIAVSGQVSQTSQIDITIDGAYDQSLAIAASQTNFEASVQLSVGTHTLELRAIDRCQVEDATEKIVVTYQPKASDGRGSDTPTTVVSGDSRSVQSGGGVTIIKATEPGVSQSPRSDLPLIGPITEGFRAIDFDTWGLNGLFGGAIRVICIVVGGFLLVFGPLGFSWLTGLLRKKHLQKFWQHRTIIRSALTRLFGAALLILAVIV